MASWRRHCSSQTALRTERPWRICAALLAAALLASGCGNASEPERADAGEALCAPAATGALRARLQGAIDAEIDWNDSQPQCLAGLRPDGDGLRLLYKGTTEDGEPLLLVFGLAGLQPGQSARNVATNVTVVREGSGKFYATQGEDKCACDEVIQTPIADQPGLFRLEGRGYCTQPARAVAGDGAVLLPRFDVVAIVPGAEPADATESTAPGVEP
jgi:hypothetical protein